MKDKDNKINNYSIKNYWYIIKGYNFSYKIFYQHFTMYSLKQKIIQN